MSKHDPIATRGSWFILISLTVLTVVALGGCGPQEHSAKKSQPSQSADTAASSAAPATSAGSAKPDDYSVPTPQLTEMRAKDEPPLPPKDHYYSMRDGQQYGYEQSLSAIDKAQGVAAKPLTMIHYLGLQDNTHQMAFGNPSAPVEIAECSKPCDFVKIRRSPPQSFSESPETIRAEKGTILWAIMHDAMNGKLERAFVMDKTYNHEGVQVGQVVPSIVEKHYFRAAGPTVQLIPESKLGTK